MTVFEAMKLLFLKKAHIRCACMPCGSYVALSDEFLCGAVAGLPLLVTHCEAGLVINKYDMSPEELAAKTWSVV